MQVGLVLEVVVEEATVEAMVEVVEEKGPEVPWW